LGHGACEFLRESMMERGDEYQMVVCNTTGAIAIYNKARDLFMSPMADGPLRFFRSETGKGFALDTMTKYGRRFSVISIPYSLKLLIQELAAINIQLRIVTEDNLQQIDSMAFSDNMNRLTLKPDMTPDKLVKEMERALRTGEAPVRTPRPLNTIEEKEYDKEQMEIEATNKAKREFQEKERQRREDELREKGSPAYPDGSPQYPDVSPTYVPPEGYVSEYPQTSPAYVPYSNESSLNAVSPAYIPGTPESSATTLGGSAHSVADFELGEQVYFTRSADLGLQQNHAWTIAKKGGSLLTLTTNRESVMGGDSRGGISTNLTNSDLVQIAKPDELMKYDAYSQWQEQRAGARQQMLEQQQYMAQQPIMQNPMPQVPQINIKMVGGNDFSKGEESGNGGSGSDSNSISVSGGATDSNAFNNLVIPPSMKGGDSSFKKDEPPKKSEKTIMGGLADFGSLVINKIM